MSVRHSMEINKPSPSNSDHIISFSLWDNVAIPRYLQPVYCFYRNRPAPCVCLSRIVLFSHSWKPINSIFRITTIVIKKTEGKNWPFILPIPLTCSLKKNSTAPFSRIVIPFDRFRHNWNFTQALHPNTSCLILELLILGLLSLTIFYSFSK